MLMGKFKNENYILNISLKTVEASSYGFLHPHDGPPTLASS
jgi:hypothetical protein